LPKRVDFSYNAIGQFTQISRHSDLAGGPMSLVAATSFTYDTLERITQLTHTAASLASPVNYTYTFDTLDRITSFTDADGAANYSYDPTSQLLSAVHTPLPTANSPLPDESYSYDLNGNRTNPGYVTQGDNHLVQSVVDGRTYSYAYDAEGNMTVRIDVETGTRTEYTWDHRNRLTHVELINSQGMVVRTVDFSYDALNRRIRKVVGPIDPGPDGVPANGQAPNPAWPYLPTEYYVYDGAHIALVYFDRKGPGNGGTAELRSRLLYGPLVDQVLADESHAVTGRDNTTLGQEGLFWLLSDHQGSIRDVLNSAACDGTGHIEYTAFGRIARITNNGQSIPLSALGSHRFLYTGREFDYSAEFIGGGHATEINFQYNRARYYDAAIGRWLSADPLGFAAGDANLYRYVGNSPSLFIDPSGLKAACLGDDGKAYGPGDAPEKCTGDYETADSGNGGPKMNLPGSYWERLWGPALDSRNEISEGVGKVAGNVADGNLVEAGRQAVALRLSVMSRSSMDQAGLGAMHPGGLIAAPLIQKGAGLLGQNIDPEMSAHGSRGALFVDTIEGLLLNLLGAVIPTGGKPQPGIRGGLGGCAEGGCFVTSTPVVVFANSAIRVDAEQALAEHQVVSDSDSG